MKMPTIINCTFILIIITIFLKCDGYSRSNELRVNIKISNNNKTIYCRDEAQECHKMAMFLDPFFLMGLVYTLKNGDRKMGLKETDRYG